MTLAMIQALIPLGLRAVEEALQQEVTAFAGARYARQGGTPGVVRWGQQAGSIFLTDQKLPIMVPRVRDQVARSEVPLATYATLQTPRALDTGLFRRVLGGILCREYEAAAEAVPEAFGLAKSSVSRRFVRASASARALRQLHERRHDDAEWLVLLLDGKTFASDQMVIALGVTTAGDKRILGMVQTATENKRVCAAFLRELQERGFQATDDLLVVLDGAKGLRAAVREAYGDVPVQRCQWHKRENVVSYLTKPLQVVWRRNLQAAYAHTSYADAKRALQRLVRELTTINASAARSLEEGLEETLTLHRLGVVAELGTSFKTTNLIESVMARVEAKTRRVDRWRTSDQKWRWCAAASMQIEQQFRKVKGCKKLGLLQQALKRKLHRVSSTAA
ncbi:transposase [Gemmatimonas sp.]|uniref:IS256 family transposase n=1 Tax=Gemmatimonas sp. TaxID=1962908 RepID=UPI0035658008